MLKGFNHTIQTFIYYPCYTISMISIQCNKCGKIMEGHTDNQVNHMLRVHTDTQHIKNEVVEDGELKRM